MNDINIKPIQNKLKPATPGLIMASLLLWGWQTEYILYAIIMGLLLEFPFFIKWRIEFSDKDMNQLADLSGILFFVVTVYVFVNYGFQGIFKIIGLVPFALFILMLAQNYSAQNSIKTSALFISIRRMGDKADSNVLYNTNISLPYVFLCLISASSGNQYSEIFFFCSSLIIAWTLWGLRAKHYSFIYWFMPIVTVVSLSFLTQQGLQQLQENAEKFFLTLFEQYGLNSRDPGRTSTSIGSLGRLKLSDRIVFRIISEKKLDTPLYYRETSYSIYEYGTWRNPNVEFDIIEKTPTKKEWRLDNKNKDKGHFDVAMFLQDQSAILPVPDNINSLTGKDLIQVETSIYGSTRVEAREGWISYRIGYVDDTNDYFEIEPTADDLSIPLNYQEDFKQVAEELELYSKTPNEVVAAVSQYFKDNFYYSITQNQRYTKGQYLTKFLFKDKKGHCEYFATATALLLREAGIATRYTIGYSVQEYSPWQNMYLVRARHAHAWLKYYANGKWHNMDTTPSIWAPMEAEDKTIMEPFFDLVSFLRYKIIGSDIESKTESNEWMIWLLIPLMAYLGWRFYNKQRVDTQKTRNDNFDTKLKRFGMDSPIYPLIQTLEHEADTRLSGETLNKWIKRILPITEAEKYLDLIKLHSRYRFNPASNKQQDKESIQTVINNLMK
jgi:protein-glutamine gamma-glutamyltransferase